MPLVDYKLSMLRCQGFCVSQLARLQAHGLPQNDLIFHFEHRLTSAFANVDMNGSVLVAVEEKPESILYENGRHRPQ
jgi:hypothetical protein